LLGNDDASANSEGRGEVGREQLAAFQGFDPEPTASVAAVRGRTAATIRAAIQELIDAKHVGSILSCMRGWLPRRGPGARSLPEIGAPVGVGWLARSRAGRQTARWSSKPFLVG